MVLLCFNVFGMQQILYSDHFDNNDYLGDGWDLKSGSITENGTYISGTGTINRSIEMGAGNFTFWFSTKKSYNLNSNQHNSFSMINQETGKGFYTERVDYRSGNLNTVIYRLRCTGGCSCNQDYICQIAGATSWRNYTFTYNDDTNSLELGGSGCGTYPVSCEMNENNSYWNLETTLTGTQQEDIGIIGNPICLPDWGCSVYNSCQPNNIQNCSIIDSNECGTNYTGDYSEFSEFEQACDYCQLNQIYSSQTSCVAGNKTIYYEDLNFNICCNVTGIGNDCIGNMNQTESIVGFIQSCSVLYDSEDLSPALINIFTKGIIFLSSVIIVIIGIIIISIGIGIKGRK